VPVASHPAGGAEASDATTTDDRIKPASGGQLAAVVAGVLLVAGLLALVISPGKRDSEFGASPRVVATTPATTAEPTAVPTTEQPAVPQEAKPQREQPPASQEPKPRRAGQAAALRAARRVEVAVLSGVDIPGIAARTGERLKRERFRVGTIGNSAAPLGRSVVLYGAGARRPAIALGRRLRIRSVRRIDPSNRAIAPTARLIVVLGADRRP
jgi:hypothetical protein